MNRIKGKILAFDCETTGLGVWQGDCPFAFAFYNEEGERWYWEFEVEPETRRVIYENRESQLALEQMAEVLGNRRITKVMHNAKFDIRMMERNFGIYTRGEMHDTLIMAHVANTLEPSLALKKLAAKYCDIDTEDQDLLQKVVVRLRRRGVKIGYQIAYNWAPQPHGPPKRKAAVAADYWMPRTMHLRKELPSGFEGSEELCGRYALLDVERTMCLYHLYQEVIKEQNCEYIYNEVERKLWPVIHRMETRGVSTDIPVLQQQQIAAIAEMDRLYPGIEARSWPGFRPKNDNDVRRLFYDILDLPIDRMTKGGKLGDKKQPAVDKFVILQHIDIPLVKDIAIWKANHTAFTGFFSKFERMSIPDTFGGLTSLHCDYRQTGPATGRLSSATPNLQNVMTPKNTMAVHPIPVRPAFIPRPGYSWLCCDYEGMEVRMFAAVSGEPFMMEVIRQGRSIHDEMTNLIWGGPGNEEAVKQAIRALSLDGTGIHSSPEVDELWAQWGVTADNVLRLSHQERFDLAERWLASHDYNQVRAQASIGRKNSKTSIKSLTFLRIYGGGARKASLLLKVPPREAGIVLDNYDRLFPRIDEYFNELLREGRTNGYITSMWGRRLSIDPYYAYRATNYMVQGSSADLMKRSLIRIDEWLRYEGLDAHVLMTIHDEIIIEVRKELLTRPFIRKICSIMSDPEGHISIDMPVEAKVALNSWEEKVKVKYERIPAH